MIWLNRPVKQRHKKFEGLVFQLLIIGKSDCLFLLKNVFLKGRPWVVHPHLLLKSYPDCMLPIALLDRQDQRLPLTSCCCPQILNEEMDKGFRVTV